MCNYYHTQVKNFDHHPWYTYTPLNPLHRWKFVYMIWSISFHLLYSPVSDKQCFLFHLCEFNFLVPNLLPQTAVIPPSLSFANFNTAIWGFFVVSYEMLGFFSIYFKNSIRILIEIPMNLWIILNGIVTYNVIATLCEGMYPEKLHAAICVELCTPTQTAFLPNKLLLRNFLSL